MENQKKKYSYLFAVMLLAGTIITSCKKMVEINPPSTAITDVSVYNDNTSTEAVMSGLFYTINSGQHFFDGPTTSFGGLNGLAADELNYLGNAALPQQFYQNAYNTSNGTPFFALYAYIYTTNAVISGVSGSTKLSSVTHNQMLGEAYFMRALFYFYLVNYYGDVPLVTSTDYRVNNLIARTPKAQVYAFIVSDLKQAQSLLADHFVDQSGNPSPEHIRPNKWTATALLARVYLYLNQYSDAKNQASAVIDNSGASLESDLNNVFLANSNEALWQLYPVGSVNTYNGYFYVMTKAPVATSPIGVYAVSSGLVNAFEPGDKRFGAWVGSYTDPKTGNSWYYPFKYKVHTTGPPLTEYVMVLRLAEQYLIRAEAEANNNDPNDAVSDINTIRTRAGLGPYTGARDVASLMNAILQERRVELFTEGGHRWFDLIRTGKIDSVMGTGGACAAKGGTWESYKALMPLSQSYITSDPKLTQTLGYN